MSETPKLPADPKTQLGGALAKIAGGSGVLGVLVLAAWAWIQDIEQRMDAVEKTAQETHAVVCHIAINPPSCLMIPACGEDNKLPVLPAECSP